MNVFDNVLVKNVSDKLTSPFRPRQGHGLPVLKGGLSLFERSQVRDVVSEEHARDPAPVARFFNAEGHRLFLIGSTPFGPALHSTAQSLDGRRGASGVLSHPPTLGPARAIARLRSKGRAARRAGAR